MQRFLLLLVVLGAIFGLPSLSFADEPNLVRDFSQASPNGEFLFVLLANDTIDSYNQAGSVLHNESLRQSYSQSGLYRNDGSNTPLWTVDWNANEVIVSSDGHSLVRWGPFPVAGRFDEVALEFYRDGRLLRSYRVEDLVREPSSLPETVSHYLWLKTSNYDDTIGQLSLETETGEQYRFDLQSGAIVEASGRFADMDLVRIALLVLVISGFFVVLLKRR